MHFFYLYGIAQKMFATTSEKSFCSRIHVQRFAVVCPIRGDCSQYSFGSRLFLRSFRNKSVLSSSREKSTHYQYNFATPLVCGKLGNEKKSICMHIYDKCVAHRRYIRLFSVLYDQLFIRERYTRLLNCIELVVN